MTRVVNQATRRRRFIKYLAASPLFAGAPLSALAEETLFPEWPPDPYVWAPRDYEHLISDPNTPDANGHETNLSP